MHEPDSSPRLAAVHQLHGLQPVLPVSDLAASVRFYCETLGLELDFLWGEPPEYARMKHTGDGAAIYIHLSQTAADKPIVPCGTLRIYVGSDVDALFAAYTALGIVIESPPVSQPWGLREFVVRDPDRHRFLFCAELEVAAGSTAPS